MFFVIFVLVECLVPQVDCLLRVSTTASCTATLLLYSTGCLTDQSNVSLRRYGRLKPLTTCCALRVHHDIELNFCISIPISSPLNAHHPHPPSSLPPTPRSLSPSPSPPSTCHPPSRAAESAAESHDSTHLPNSRATPTTRSAAAP